MAFNIFRKLFHRNKNTIELSPEEAYVSAEEPTVPARSVEAEETAPVNKGITLTTEIFACLDDPEETATRVRSVMSDLFISVTENEDGYKGLLAEGVHTAVTIRRDEDGEASGALRSRFENAPMADKDVLNAALMQISLFDVKLTAVSEGDPEKAEEAHKNLVSRLCGAVKGFYCEENTLYRWDGKKLVGTDGSTEFTVFMPVKCASGENASADPEVLRKLRSMETLRSRGILSPCDAPVQVREDCIDLRSTEDIVSRAAALLLVSLTAKAYTSPKEIVTPAAWCASVTEKLDSLYRVKSALTPKEKSYISNPTPGKHDAFLMRAESCAVLLWALGMIDLPWPGQKQDLSALNDILKNSGFSLLCKQAHPREKGVLADEHDLITRLHYATMFAPAEELMNAGVDFDAVYERHYAMNWLVGADGITAWDNVIPRT